MKIVLVNTFGFKFGGAEKYFFDTAKLLEERGHKVIFFCMQHPKNILTDDSKYFVSHFPSFKSLSFLKKIKYAIRFFYNFEARRKFRDLIKNEKPDLVHINTISFEITHAIILEAKQQGLPIVMTVHDHGIICPQVVLLNKNKICEKCIDGSFFFCIINKCIYDSFMKSILLTLSYYFNYYILRSMDKVDLFISPSQYLKDKLKQSKICKKFNIVVMRNFLNFQKYKPEYSFTENSIVYFGRLAKEKGLEVILEAMKSLDVTLKIIGSGEKEYEQIVRKKVLMSRMKNVKFLGYLAGEDLWREVRNSMFLVFPSLCAENAPFSILESFALGKPVLASLIGGVPELINDNVTGFFFKAGDHSELRSKIHYLANQPNLLRQSGMNARIWLEKECSVDNFYQSLYKEYKKLCDL